MNLLQQLRWRVPAYVHYSADARLYYIAWGGRRPHCWLTVSETPGEVPDDKKRDGGLFGPVYFEIRPTAGGVYYRLGYAFAYWKVPRDLETSETVIDKKSALFLDYAATHDWTP